ncbi:MAG TPA: hypothetical protein DDZ88_30680 [Verrucomicrobiales bacterium]|nr:hypothetical protein [Verrucomicrobiales bacterium]
MNLEKKSKHRFFERIRLKHRDPKTMQMDSEVFRQSVELARLAVDLASLAWQRGGSNEEPLAFLDHAAHLVNEAAKLTGFSPDEAVKSMMGERWEDRAARQIPMSALYGEEPGEYEAIMEDGTKFAFARFTTERGWREFLARHFERVLPDWLKNGIFENLSKSLDSKTGVDNEQRRESALKAAIEFFYSTAWNGLEHLLDQAAKDNHKATPKNWPAVVLKRWIELQTKWSVESYPKKWKEHGLEYTVLQSLAQTRRLGNKAKGSGKRQTAKQPEGTTLNAGSPRKEQGKARKKQGRG